RRSLHTRNAPGATAIHGSLFKSPGQHPRGPKGDPGPGRSAKASEIDGDLCPNRFARLIGAEIVPSPLEVCRADLPTGGGAATNRPSGRAATAFHHARIYVPLAPATRGARPWPSQRC